MIISEFAADIANDVPLPKCIFAYITLPKVGKLRHLQTPTLVKYKVMDRYFIMNVAVKF